MSNQNLESVPRVLIELWGYDHNTQEHQNRFWAFQKLVDLVRDEPEQAWQTILDTLKLTKSNEIIEQLGTNFLETLMCEHDQLTFDFIHAELPNNRRLGRCMSYVWLEADDTKFYHKFYELIKMDPPLVEKA